MYNNSSCCIRAANGTTSSFSIISGVWQGYILSPFLFIVTIDCVMHETMDWSDFGIQWRDQHLIDLDFADDIVLLAHDIERVQHMTDNLLMGSEKLRLRISINKTKILNIWNPKEGAVDINDEPIDEIDSFQDLGSIVRNDGGGEKDLITQIGKAS